jgi:prephenate dehydrogenase
VWRDISLANKTALLDEITTYEQALAKLKQALAVEDGDKLQASFERASKARNDWANRKK